jgi:hypothetical protein
MLSDDRDDDVIRAKPLFVLAESLVPPFDLPASGPRYNSAAASH